MRRLRSSFLLISGVAFGADFDSPPRVSYVVNLGGNASVYHVTADSQGYVYASGIALAPSIACTTGSAAAPANGTSYGFIAKLSPAGDAVLWTACFPELNGNPVAANPAGSVYTYAQSGSDVSVVKLATSDGTKAWSTTISSAKATAMTIDPGGNVYVAGAAGPSFRATPFPTVRCSASDPLCTDGFLTKIADNGDSVYARFTKYSRISAIATDSKGAIWIAGADDGTPVFMAAATSGSNGFVTKIDPTGGTVAFSVGLGAGLNSPGSSGVYRSVRALGVATDANDAAYVMGYTDANAGITITPGVMQSTYGLLSENAYVVKLDAGGAVVYGTFFGPIDSLPYSIAADGDGRAYLSYGSYSGRCDGVNAVAVLSPDASKIVANVPLPTQFREIAFAPDGTLVGAAAQPGNTDDPQFKWGAVAKIDFSQPGVNRFRCILNAASDVPHFLDLGPPQPGLALDNSVAPGELVSIFGEGFQVANGVNIDFDGMSVPALYSSASQINTVVPFEVAASASTTMTLHIGDWKTSMTVPVAAARPGVFTIDGASTALALNFDGTLNSSSNPAHPGSVVTLYITGAGQFEIPTITGSIGPLAPPYPQPIQRAVVDFGSGTTPVISAAQAPGLLAGVVQVSVRIPDSSRTGPVPVTIGVGPAQAPQVTIQVK